MKREERSGGYYAFSTVIDDGTASPGNPGVGNKDVETVVELFCILVNVFGYVGLVGDVDFVCLAWVNQ